MTRGQSSYTEVGAFVDAGSRVDRMKARRIQKSRRRDKEWFAKKRAKMLKNEALAFKRAKEAICDTQLELIATEVALEALGV